MATRRTPYVYGSAAPNIEVMPRREDDYERRRQTRPVSRPRPKRKAKIDKVAVLLTALTFFVVMAAGIFYLRLQFQSTYLNKSVVKLQSEVVEMEKKNATPSVRQLLCASAEKYGEEIFIKFVRNGAVEERSYVRVKTDSEAVCRWIRSISKDGMHVAVVSKTNYEYITCITGILMSGSVVVLFAPDISAKEASELFDRADIDMVLYDSTFSENVGEVMANCPKIKHAVDLSDENFFAGIYEKYSAASEYAPLSDYEVDPDKCAVIIFTSGTTGVKKGVMLSTNALVGNIMYKEYINIFSERTSTLSVLPMHHIYCFSGDYLKNLCDGVQVCLNGNLSDIVPNLQRFEPNAMRVVPMIAQHLLQRIKITAAKNSDITPAEAAKIVLGKNLNWIVSGGAYLDPLLVEEYDKLGIMLRQGYGMTEVGCRISVPDRGVSTESVGRVINICDVRTENGEIQIKTPTIMLGYYKMPEETAKMFTEDGWFRTGDIGYVTEDRQLFITGRVKNLIILSSGENVSPEAIEKKFKKLNIVDEVVVYGENDRIVAEIYPDFEHAKQEGIEDIPAEIERRMDEINAGAKTSHFVSELRFRDEPFEKTSSGKIKRKETVVG